MSVDLLEQVVPLLEKILQVLIVLLMIAHTVVKHLARVDQSEGIISVLEESKIEDVSLNVVELVNIDCILLVSHNVKEPSLVKTEERSWLLILSFDELTHFL